MKGTGLMLLWALAILALVAFPIVHSYMVFSECRSFGHSFMYCLWMIRG